MSKGLLKPGMLSFLMLTTSGQALSQEHVHDHDDGHAENTSQKNEFSQPIKKGVQTKYWGVDCDLLEGGQITPEFVRSFGVSSHMDREDWQLRLEAQRSGQAVTDKQRLNAYVRHISAHYSLKDVKEAIIESAGKCRNEYPEKSGLEP